ncbi:hypothetical protein ACSHWB_35140 [Lentzea sp. HUAS TT2]
MEVRAHTEHDLLAPSACSGQEIAALLLSGEQLFKVIDHEHQTGSR